MQVVSPLTGLVLTVLQLSRTEPVKLELEPLAHAATFQACETIVARLVRAESVTIAKLGDTTGATLAVDPSFKVAVRLPQADTGAEKQRLEKQLEETKARLVNLEKQLQNESFVSRAKPQAVESVRKNAEDCKATIAQIEERLGAWG